MPNPPAAASFDQISGVVLAGGRGSRMGGVDKGLVLFDGEPFALRALRRLQPQVAHSMIGANRNLDVYQSFGVPVWPDARPDYAGPLAGIATALRHCPTPYLVTVPCDVPLFPEDLVERLAHAIGESHDIAMAAAPQASGSGAPLLRAQPAFCLLRTTLLPSLLRYLDAGERRVGGWVQHHAPVLVPFDDPRAFLNVNTVSDLLAVQA